MRPELNTLRKRGTALASRPPGVARPTDDMKTPRSPLNRRMKIWSGTAPRVHERQCPTATRSVSLRPAALAAANRAASGYQRAPMARSQARTDEPASCTSCSVGRR